MTLHGADALLADERDRLGEKEVLEGRLEALSRTASFGTSQEQSFDRLTRLVTRILAVPMSLISLIDYDRQLFKSCIGLPEPWQSGREMPLSHSFCRHTVHFGQPLLISDARQHPLVSQSPAIRDLGAIAYAGVPLRTSDGHLFGTLCALDSQPREWSLEEVELLQELAEVTVHAIETRAAVVEARREERQTSEMLERISDGFFAVDSSWILRYVNHRGRRVLGRGDPAEGVVLWDAFPELVGSAFETRLRRAIMEQKPVRFEERYAASGAWLEVHAYPSREGASVYFRDVTERREMEAGLRLYAQAIAATSEGVLIADARHSGHPILYANPGFQAMTGYAAAEVMGRNARFLQGVDTDPAAVDELRVALREERGCRVELLNYRKDGSPFWNALSLSPIRDEMGEVTHFVGVQKDVTAHYEVEDALRRSQEDLLQAQKLDAIGRLAGGVAHDSSNLLSVISSYAYMAKAELEEGTAVRQYVDQIEWAAERSGALTRQLLAFSRRQVLNPQVVGLNGLVTNMLKLLERLIGEQVEVLTLFEADLAPVRVDPGQMEQVLLNLAVNARDAMGAGGTLTIETRNMEGDALPGACDGPCVCLSVTDTGHGIPPENREKIFDPFFTTKEKGRGTGLGLSTVYGIVQQSGGCIELESSVGAGTTFHVYLPRVEEDESAGTRTARVVSGGTETVLVVEDDAAIRALAGRILRRRGYTVLEAANGGEAVLLCESHRSPIHLMLSDVVMPRMHGPALFERISKAHPEMCVLFMSGYTDDVFTQLGVSAPGAQLLEKPFTPDVLAYKVREALDAAWSA